jgi:hypothetical protein
MITPKEVDVLVRSLKNLNDVIQATERRAEYFKGHYYRMLRVNSNIASTLIEKVKEAAEAPDTYDVEHKEPMLYLSEVLSLIETLDT